MIILYPSDLTDNGLDLLLGMIEFIKDDVYYFLKWFDEMYWRNLW
jgi:hypothetical protein